MPGDFFKEKSDLGAGRAGGAVVGMRGERG